MRLACVCVSVSVSVSVCRVFRARPAQVTASIDDIIKGRIKEALFDDVVRKAALQPGRYKPKAAEISTEKSSVGLGEEYAREYEQTILGQTSAESAKTVAAHGAVRDLLAKLGGKLDALFSFHATPQAFKPEATVRSAMPAVQMEEATPSAMAAHHGLAPEEVYAAKRGNALTTREELSQGERKSDRRKRTRVRKRQDAERDNAENLRAKLAPGGKAAQRIQARNDEKALAEAKRKGTVIDGMGGGKGGKGGGADGGHAGSQYTRSAQFFRNLQAGGGKRGAPAAADGEAAGKSARYKL
jgi:U3 small nucleolar RNA-associated protein MPP10